MSGTLRPRSAARRATSGTSAPMAAAARGSALPWAAATRARSRMDGALGLSRACPPAAARVGAGRDPERAGRAADRGIAVIDQRVDQHAVVRDVLVDLLLGQIGR